MYKSLSEATVIFDLVVVWQSQLEWKEQNNYNFYNNIINNNNNKNVDVAWRNL